ncbi:hypothetical protein DRO64_10535 [Candidatus Bathyarchaeota archaeon]|nr:MAG: hypothetical protein DRO64_10535 [Candidatus Bathyarchaeota archaeon]
MGFPMKILALALLFMNRNSTAFIGLPIFILVGFSARLTDKTIGMVYGVLSNSIHTAETFKILASGAAPTKA